MTISVTDLGIGVSTAGTTVPLTVTVPAKSLICVFAAEINGTGSFGGSIGDGGANTYTTIAQVFNNGDSSKGWGLLSYVWNSVALTAATLVYNKKTSGTNAALAAFYATGIQNVSDPLDALVTATAVGSSSSPSVTSGTPFANGELIVSAVCSFGVLTDSFTQDPAYASPFDFAHGNAAILAGGNLVDPGLTAKTFAPTITSRPWAAFIVGFKPVPILGSRGYIFG